MVEPAPGGHPHAAVIISTNILQVIVLQALLRPVIIGVKCFELQPIKPVQPVFGGKPHEPFCILRNAVHRVIRQTIFHLVMPEIIGLTVSVLRKDKKAAQQAQRYVYDPVHLY
jgi:hypothetical protein